MIDKPQHKLMTAKECQSAKEQRATELALIVDSIPKYVPQTAKERQETNNRYLNALVVIGKELDLLETILTLNKHYQT